MTKLNQISFGEQIRSLRKKSKFSLKQVSEKLNIDNSLLAKFERNERSPSKKVIMQLAKYYKIDNHALFKQFLSDQIATKILYEEEGLDVLKVAEEKVTYLISKTLETPIIIENPKIKKHKYELNNIYNADCVSARATTRPTAQKFKFLATALFNF